MGYQLIIPRNVRKNLDELPDDVAIKIQEAIMLLAENPRPFGCRKLKGDNGYRIKVAGDYRVIYSIDEKQKTVEILNAGHRKDIYR
jgi:mRNA interferase RelE/StbE